jgi:hypothetical protein
MKFGSGEQKYMPSGNLFFKKESLNKQLLHSLLKISNLNLTKDKFCLILTPVFQYLIVLKTTF